METNEKLATEYQMQVVLMVCKCLTALRLRTESVRDDFCRDSYYFSLVIDWIMTTTTTGRKNGMYSEHSGIHSVTLTVRMTWYYSHNQIQDKTTFHENASEGLRLKFEKKKTELMKMNTTADTPCSKSQGEV